MQGVFSSPPLDDCEGLVPFDMMADCPPIRPPESTKNEAPPLLTENLRANWFTDPVVVSLTEISTWKYAKTDIRRFTLPGVPNAGAKFAAYTNAIGPLYAIPPNLTCDRTFLIHPEHGPFVESASHYLAGEVGSLMTETSIYCLPFSIVSRCDSDDRDVSSYPSRI